MLKPLSLISLSLVFSTTFVACGSKNSSKGDKNKSARPTQIDLRKTPPSDLDQYRGVYKVEEHESFFKCEGKSKFAILLKNAKYDVLAENDDKTIRSCGSFDMTMAEDGDFKDATSTVNVYPDGKLVTEVKAGGIVFIKSVLVPVKEGESSLGDLLGAIHDEMINLKKTINDKSINVKLSLMMCFSDGECDYRLTENQPALISALSDNWASVKPQIDKLRKGTKESTIEVIASAKPTLGSKLVNKFFEEFLLYIPADDSLDASTFKKNLKADLKTSIDAL